jgi:hypothetical protein
MSINKNNTKKILCYNIITGKKCNYGNKCLYAHNLDEQNICGTRAKAYDILKGDDNLDDINLVEDSKLYETLCQLTKVCSSCEKNVCSGGYNCRNGSINKSLKVCYDDLVYGNCKYIKCNFIHLTNRGLVPYLRQKNINKYDKINPKGLYRSFFKKNNSPQKSNDSNTDSETNLIEFLFFTKNMNTESSDSFNDEDTDDIVDYLNNDNDSSDESIFII